MLAGCGGGKAPPSRLTLETYLTRLRSIPAGTFQMGGDSLSYLAIPVHPVMLLAEVDKRLMKVMGMR